VLFFFSDFADMIALAVNAPAGFIAMNATRVIRTPIDFEQLLSFLTPATSS
jgi:hypothetical protein